MAGLSSSALISINLREHSSLLRNVSMLPSGPSASDETIILGRFEPRLEAQIRAATFFNKRHLLSTRVNRVLDFP
jgi:hypothetical protein